MSQLHNTTHQFFEVKTMKETRVGLVLIKKLSAEIFMTR